jgi:putative flippase GtrA
MAVQLAALALLNRWAAGHYLYAAAAAIELALLHNFVWHLHYTWRDRREASPVLSQFIRFHLSNGLVSMVGYPQSRRTLLRFFAVRLSISVWAITGHSRQGRRQPSARRRATLVPSRHVFIGRMRGSDPSLSCG